MSTPKTDVPAKPWASRLLPDFLAFGATVTVSYLLKWETKDLAWSPWLSSLVSGYLTLLAALGVAVHGGLHSIRRRASGEQ